MASTRGGRSSSDEISHARETGRPADQAETTGRGDQDFVQFLPPRDDVGQIAFEIDVAEDICVGQTEIGVEEDDLLAGGGELNREIDGDIALSDAALAAA